jgi:hypothetical protein
MSETIIDGNGSGYYLKINSDGSINANSVATTSNDLNRFLYLGYSGTTIGIGSVIGSIIQYIGAGSTVQVFTYDANYNISIIGSKV